MTSAAHPPVREKPLPRGVPKSYVEEVEARIAVLEQIAQDTKAILVDMKQDIRDIRLDQKMDFRLLFGALITTTIGLAYLMARGFHWL
jgi:hypothetical protein